MKKIYIASPYTLGDVALNVKKQMDIADLLMTEGYAPFVQLYSHFQHMMNPRPYEDWLKMDFIWLAACDVVLRLYCESKGADREVEHAKKLNIPVVYSVNYPIAKN